MSKQKPPSTDAQIQSGREWYAEYSVSKLDKLLARCESPIEQLFLIGTLRLPWIELDPDEGRNGMWFAGDGQLRIYLQHDLTIAGRRARLDFAFVRDDLRVAIELDGHDFHERTKEQAGRDKSRDRALTKAGWRVLRFTGSEVWASASECAWQAWELFYPDPESK